MLEIDSRYLRAALPISLWCLRSLRSVTRRSGGCAELGRDQRSGVCADPSARLHMQPWLLKPEARSESAVHGGPWFLLLKGVYSSLTDLCQSGYR